MTIARRFIRWLSSALDVDGLDTTEYVEHIEREFGIVIRDEAVGTLATLGDLCVYVSRQRQEQARPLSGEEVWDTVRRITAYEFGVDAGELHPGIRYVEDLNC
jgi:acyl carrier protein